MTRTWARLRAVAKVAEVYDLSPEVVGALARYPVKERALDPKVEALRTRSSIRDTFDTNATMDRATPDPSVVTDAPANG